MHFFFSTAKQINHCLLQYFKLLLPRYIVKHLQCSMRWFTGSNVPEPVISVFGQIIQRCHLVVERKYCTMCVRGFIWKHYYTPPICNDSGFSNNTSHVALTFLTRSDWVTCVFIKCFIKSSVLVRKGMILIFSSIFDHYKYALAFFPFMHVPFQEQPKSLHSSQQHILVRLCMCVTEQPCPLFHPEKTEIFRLHPAPSLSNTPPPISPSASTQLWSAPAATLERWQSEERESGEEGKGERKMWQLLNKCGTPGKERARERKREKKGALFWWWASRHGRRTRHMRHQEVLELG